MSIAQEILKKLDVLPEERQREVLDFAEFLEQRQGNDAKYSDNEEHRALGQSGAKLATEVLPVEDFSDWPGFKDD